MSVLCTYLLCVLMFVSAELFPLLGTSGKKIDYLSKDLTGLSSHEVGYRACFPFYLSSHKSVQYYGEHDTGLIGETDKTSNSSVLVSV